MVSTLERERAAKVPIQGVVRPTAGRSGFELDQGGGEELLGSISSLGDCDLVTPDEGKKIRFSNVGRSWDVLLFMENHETCHFWGSNLLLAHFGAHILGCVS